MDYISGIETAFKTYIGEDSIDKLREAITDKPMILIAGDQLTGKSTQAKNLADFFDGSFHSVGALFREAAKNRGITVAEQAKLLLVERGIDVEIDYKTCQVITGSDIDTSLGVVEGRQPAYMGSFMTSLGKKNVIRLYLQCSIREQALRFLRREVGEEAYLAGKEQIPEKDYKNLESLNTAIENLDIGQMVDCTKFIQRDMYIKQFGLKPGETAFDNETYQKHYKTQTPPIIIDFKNKINNNPLGNNLLCATGDNFVTEFNSDLSDIEKPYDEDLSVIDMEAYALAKIAFSYNISFISFKYITDNLNSKGSSDWEKHVSKGAKKFKKLLQKYK